MITETYTYNELSIKTLFNLSQSLPAALASIIIDEGKSEKV